MSKSYEDYEEDYNSLLTRIRSFLAGTRTASTLSECQRLLTEAKQAATALQGLAEVDGDFDKIQQAKNRLIQEIAPLEQEIQRCSNQSQNNSNLFYQPPPSSDQGFDNHQMSLDTQSLIRNSEDLLLDSQAVLAETEQIGMDTLHQMGQQREQLQIASDSMSRTQEAIEQASILLKSMRRKLLKNKMFLKSILTLLILANCFVLYLIAKKHSSSSSGRHYLF